MREKKGIKIALIIIIIVLACAICFFVIERILTSIGMFQSDHIDTNEIEQIVNELKTNLDNDNMNISIKSKNAEAVHAATELLYDDPEYFWIARDYSIVSVSGHQSVMFSVYYPNHKEMLAEAEAVAVEIINDIPEKSTDYEVVKYVHDELCNRISYVDTDSEYEHNIYGALVNGEAVCEGYAKAFMYVLQKAGMETMYFSGTSSRDGVAVAHGWNGVYLDGELYYFDITWDDVESECVSYSNFALNSEEVLKNHSFDELHPMIVSTADKYNYYSYNDLVLYEYSKENVADIIRRQGNVIDFKCNSIIVYQKLVSAIQNPYQLNELLTAADSDNTGFNSYAYMVDDNTYCVRLFFE